MDADIARKTKNLEVVKNQFEETQKQAFAKGLLNKDGTPVRTEKQAERGALLRVY
jgi:hypothetical protein